MVAAVLQAVLGCYSAVSATTDSYPPAPPAHQPLSFADSPSHSQPSPQIQTTLGALRATPARSSTSREVLHIETSDSSNIASTAGTYPIRVEVLWLHLPLLHLAQLHNGGVHDTVQPVVHAVQLLGHKDACDCMRLQWMMVQSERAAKMPAAAAEQVG